MADVESGAKHDFHGACWYDFLHHTEQSPDAIRRIPCIVGINGLASIAERWNTVEIASGVR